MPKSIGSLRRAARFEEPIIKIVNNVIGGEVFLIIEYDNYLLKLSFYQPVLSDPSLKFYRLS